MRNRTSWYGSLLAGGLPFLLLGFLASALANRLIFVTWGMASAAAYAAWLRFGWQAGWRRSRLAASTLALTSGALVLYAGLVGWHRETLDLGLRALLPALYHPVLTSPSSGYASALLTATLAAILALSSRQQRGTH